MTTCRPNVLLVDCIRADVLGRRSVPTACFAAFAAGGARKDRRQRLSPYHPMMLAIERRQYAAGRLGVHPARRPTLIAAARAAGCANGFAVAVDWLESWCRWAGSYTDRPYA